MRARVLLRWSLAWWLVALPSGCVLKSKHELVEIQLEATRTAFSTRAAQCETTIRELEAEIEQRDAKLGEAAVRVDQLRTLSELKDAELETVVAEQVAIAEELRLAREELEDVRGQLARLEELERLRQARRRRRSSRQPEPPPAKEPPGEEPPGEEAPSEEAPPEGPTEADRIAQSAGERALATLQARVLAQLDRELAQRLDDQTHDRFATELRDLVRDGFITLERTEEGTVLSIETRRLFQEGWATLSPRGRQLVQSIGAILSDLPGRVVSVEGHTDDEPVHSAQYPSNWERGFGSAMAVLRQLAAIDPHLRISAVSHSSRRPRVPHDEPGAAAQNRRVEIVVRADPDLLERDAVDDDGAGELDEPPSPPSGLDDPDAVPR